jgi:uncharacterized membrane protein
MTKILDMVRGFPGHPSHPPLTDVSIGAYTVGVAMLVLGALGVETTAMAHGALLAISGGLIVAVPTAITGLADWLRIPRATPARTVATIHLLTMVSATVLFAVTWVLQRPGYLHGHVLTRTWIVALVAEAVLAAGGYLGGTIVFVYGERVEGRRQAAPTDALRPRPARSAPPSSGQAGVPYQGQTR